MIYLLIAVIISACSSAAPKKPNWVTVFDSNQKPAAGVDTNNGEVIYYQSPKEAFEALFGAYIKLSNQKEVQGPPVEKKK